MVKKHWFSLFFRFQVHPQNGVHTKNQKTQEPPIIGGNESQKTFVFLDFFASDLSQQGSI